MHNATASTSPLTLGRPGVTRAWFCLLSQPKHEHIAAGYLRQFEDVEVFNPRIQFNRPTKFGPALVCESMFPSYLFAKFDWVTGLAKVRYANGVKGVVHFGDRWPTIPDEVIEDLQALVGRQEVHVVPSSFQPGDTVSVSGGVFHGLEAVITQVMPARKRVVVLMNFLGGQRTVELETSRVFKCG